MSHNLGFNQLLSQYQEKAKEYIPHTTEDIPDLWRDKLDQIVVEMDKLYTAKDTDYASGKPMANLRRSSQLGIPPWRAVCLRISDKISRLESFVSRRRYEVKTESVIDTLRDTAVYCILGTLLYQEESDSPLFPEAMEHLAVVCLQILVLSACSHPPRPRFWKRLWSPSPPQSAPEWGYLCHYWPNLLAGFQKLTLVSTR